MIFDDLNNPPPNQPPAEPTRRRRRRPGSSGASSGSEDPERHRRRRRGSSGSSFREASRLDETLPARKDGNHTAWLVVLVLLVLAALGFAWFLHQERSAPFPLPGEAPSAQLLPYIDPVLAPLETGTTGYRPESLAELQARFRDDRQMANLDGQDIYGAAATIAQILHEALEDRTRHMERLVKLGFPVEGMPSDPAARTDLPESERRHLELAVGISWQRNSATYRNRVEELWYRLLRLEQGRFRLGSAPQSMMPDLPASTAPNE
jgi:hypothetical protein